MQAVTNRAGFFQKLLNNKYAVEVLSAVRDFRVQLLLVFLAAVLIRFLFIIVWDPGLEADATQADLLCPGLA